MTRNEVLSILILFLLKATVHAQDVSGAISGTVLDPSGAAVANAKVTVTNTDRNQVVRVFNTDSGGAYSIPGIPIGTYTMTAEAAGFSAAVVEGITVNVNDNIKLNISLTVGAVSDRVTVQAEVATVELNTAASATTIAGTQIRELSLATRNYEQLVGLMPGVSANQTDQLFIGVGAPAGTANTMPFSINGQRNSANNWTLDGADNVDRGSNLTLLNYPSIDALTEFKVLRSLYTADSGRAGGAQINVVTKSGTNQFHGTLFEFLRNNYFVANNWVNNATRVNLVSGVAQVPPLRWNDFGGTIGGPVKKDKTFLFFSQEDRRIVTYTTFNPTVPTASWLQGQFATPVCVALSGSTCAQTATSIAPIDPVAQSYIKDIYSKLALPVSGTQILSSQRNVYNHNQSLVRVDHSFSQKFSIFGRFLYDSIPTTEPGGLFTGSPIPGGASTESNAPGRSLVVHAQNIIRPNLLNEGGFNLSQGAIHSTPLGLTSTANSPDIKVNLPFPSTLGVVPSLTFSSLLTTTGNIVGFGPYDEYNRNYTYFDNLSWVKGAHTLKVGVSVNRYQKTENAAGNNYGTFSFASTGAPTGTSGFQQAFANFLLGRASTFTQTSKDLTPNLHAWQTEAYGQDEYRWRKNLTIYAGVRYSFFGQPDDSNGLLTNFVPALFKSSSAPQISTATGNIVAGTGVNPSLNGIAIGGGNSPWGGAVGPSSKANFAPRIGIAWDPFGDGKTSIRSGYGIYYDSMLFATYEQNAFTNPPNAQSISYSNVTLQNPVGGTLNVSAAPLVLRATPSSSDNPYTQHWSFDVQRLLAGGVVLDAGYFGSKGTHLIGIVDINQAFPGVALAAGLHTGAGTIFTPTDTPRINAVRPYLGFNAINTILPAFDSNYHSLQVSVNKNFGAQGLFSLSYTWAKNLTDNPSDRSNAPQNSYNWHGGEYGPATLDRRQVLTFNYVYSLPFFKNAKGALGYVAKGWEISGISTFSTGLPFTVTTSNVDPGGLGLLGSSAASSRPDMICDPNATAPHDRAFNGKWFDTSCFAPVRDGVVRPGNAGRGVVRGPGYSNWNISLFKNIPVRERASVQLRLETFNTFNHPSPNGISSLNITSGTFGLINSYRDPRLVQLAAKVVF